jgi:hypothetical protein
MDSLGPDGKDIDLCHATGVERGQHVDADSSHHMLIPILHHRAALQVIDM